MSPDKIAILVAIVFVALLLSHYLALKIGFRMGNHTEPSASIPNLKKLTTYTERPDIYDEERLDFE